jgi:hypothetical protein
MGVVAFDQVDLKEGPLNVYLVPYLGAAGGATP